MTRGGLVILISGRGSNMQAIWRATRVRTIPAEVSAVISSAPNAGGLAQARAAGIPTETISHRDFSARTEFDQALARAIDNYDPKLVVLAGFMRLLSDEFVRHYDGRLINIHPSLLPAFPGLDTHRRALEAGVKQHGASVHFVAPAMDSGPIIIQARVPVLPQDTPDTLGARVLEQEHRIFPLAIAWFMQGRLTLADGRVLLDGAMRPEQGLTGP